MWQVAHCCHFLFTPAWWPQEPPAVCVSIGSGQKMGAGPPNFSFVAIKLTTKQSDSLQTSSLETITGNHFLQYRFMETTVYSAASALDFEMCTSVQTYHKWLLYLRKQKHTQNTQHSAIVCQICWVRYKIHEKERFFFQPLHSPAFCCFNCFLIATGLNCSFVYTEHWLWPFFPLNEINT